MSDKDTLAEGVEAFELCREAAQENQDAFTDDKRFARLGEQWPETILKQRDLEERPHLTINKLPAFTRQVVNDARQNKPSVKVHPVDSFADPHTAKVLDGLIRNIEYSSSADVAYDTGIENAVDGGFGYWRINLDYAYDDAFDMDIMIDRVPDPTTIFPDPFSTAADSSDWNLAFAIERKTKRQFKQEWPGAKEVDFTADVWKKVGDPWLEDEIVLVAEWWERTEAKRKLLLMSNGMVLDAQRYEGCKAYLDSQGVTVLRERDGRSWDVTKRIMSGAEILDEEKWPGHFIPIVPVYGDEVWVDGKRHLISLIRDAKDPQRMFNYWRTTSTELIALAPKAPWVGAVGAFVTDAAKWSTANRQSHSTLEYDHIEGAAPPQRQAFAGIPAGVLQEALNASDDIKAVTGIYDASLGARSNETSGRAITARQMEGDTSTFHFIDNLSRAIRHTGRVLLDLIPVVYTKDRIVRILGENGEPSQVQLGVPQPVLGPDGKPAMDEQGAAIERIYDLAAGRYDLTVKSGPSFNTRRQEASAQMVEMMRAFPASAPVIGPILAKQLDWPGADEIAKKLEEVYAKMTGGGEGEQPGVPPELIKQVQQLHETLQHLQAENFALKNDKEIDAGKLRVDAFNAETKRLQVATQAMKPTAAPRAPDPSSVN